MKNYVGAVEVLVRARWYVDVDFSDFANKPTPKQMLKALNEDEDGDVVDEEVFEIVKVLHVGDNDTK